MIFKFVYTTACGCSRTVKTRCAESTLLPLLYVPLTLDVSPTPGGTASYPIRQFELQSVQEGVAYYGERVFGTYRPYSPAQPPPLPLPGT